MPEDSPFNTEKMASFRYERYKSIHNLSTAIKNPKSICLMFHPPHNPKESNFRISVLS